jgi:hypothetical protein
VAEVIIRHSEDGFIVRHVADDTGHIHKPGQFAGPLAAVACNNLIAAILKGTHQRRLVHAAGTDGLHKTLHFRIVPDTKGVFLERMQLREVDIDDFLLDGASSVAGSGRNLRGRGIGFCPFCRSLGRGRLLFFSGAA